MSTVNPHMTGSGSSKSAKNSDQTIDAAETVPARLCYVDDSRTSAYVVKRMLRPYGYAVDHFDSAEPALIALVKEDYDLLLTDLKVSPTGMDGDDLVRALRNSGHEKISSLPIIVITGSTDENVLKEVYEAGANQILSKPVNGDELDEHIRNLVQGATPSQNGSESEASDTEPSQAKSDFIPTPEKAGATVVPFGSDSIATKQGTPQRADNDLADADIPILNTSPGDTDSLPDSSRTAGRRNLKTDSTVEEGVQQEEQTKITPQPIVNVQPASRVTPTIRKPKVGNTSSKITNTATQATKGSEDEAASEQSLSPEQIAARQHLLKARALAKKRKLLAAEAVKKKSTVTQQPTTKVPASTKQAKTRLDINKIPTDHLSLEPKGNEAIEAGATSAAPSVKPEFGGGTAAKQEAKSGVDNGIPNDRVSAPGDAVAQPPAPIPNKDNDTRGNFQAEVEAATNILQEMERYPLVEADLSANYTPSRVVSAMGSVLELYGPKKIISTIFLLVAAFFAYSAYQEYFDEGDAVEVTSVEQGEIFQAITVPGKVVSKLKVNLTPSIAGRLTHVYVEEGDTVKSGDLLARLDDREAKSQLNRAKANYESAKEDVVVAQRALKRLKAAYDKGAVARNLVEEAETELRSAKARASIQEEEVRTAKLSLENPRIVAPFSGTVTARYVEVGQWVVPSETLFTLIDEKQREVEVQVDAADSGGIAVGQTVTLSSDAFPGLEWNESVTRLAAATSNVGNANTVSVYISLGNNAPSLRFGQQVDADIRTAWNPNALKLPFAAIINQGGKTHVATIHNNKVRFVEVVTGIEDFSNVEILQGVNLGQSVILANGLELRENQKVYIASNSR